jgi:hypothetical protein
MGICGYLLLKKSSFSAKHVFFLPRCNVVFRRQSNGNQSDTAILHFQTIFILTKDFMKRPCRTYQFKSDSPCFGQFECIPSGKVRTVGKGSKEFWCGSF